MKLGAALYSCKPITLGDTGGVTLYCPSEFHMQILRDFYSDLQRIFGKPVMAWSNKEEYVERHTMGDGTVAQIIDELGAELAWPITNW